MEEIWKPIKGYEGYYEASSLGRIKSLKRKVTHRNSFTTIKERILKQQQNTHGYLVVFLYNKKEKKQILVSRLIYETFKGKLIENMVIDHIDNDKTNNSIYNIQQITSRKNTSKDRNGYTSKYVGVSWDKSNNKWLANIHIKGKTKNIGRFINEEDASKAYQIALNKLLK